MDSGLSEHRSRARAVPDGSGAQPVLIFVVEESRYAVRLTAVLEVTPAAAVVSPSGSGSALVGYLDLRGEVIAVFDARHLLALPARELRLSDRFVVVRAAGRDAAIVVDRVEGVEEVEDSLSVTASDPHRKEGLTLRRRVGAPEGEALVAMMDLDRILADVALQPTEGAA